MVDLMKNIATLSISIRKMEKRENLFHISLDIRWDRRGICNHIKKMLRITLKKHLFEIHTMSDPNTMKERSKLPKGYYLDPNSLRNPKEIFLGCLEQYSMRRISRVLELFTTLTF